MLGNLLGGFIVILVGVNLIPTVANQVTAAQAGNVTGAASTVLGLTTIFFSLGIMSAGVSLAIGGLRNAGMI
jgi:multisubunit Na+/H+ antiporter MnhG subunit